MTTQVKVIGLIAWVGACFLIAWFGSRFLPGEWYAQLAKPSWNPPGWIFGPVWTLLYLGMGVAAWLVWRRSGFGGATAALTLFIVQLVANGLWSWIFFGMHKMGLAFVEILLLWVAILATLIAFWQQSTVAGALMLPYLGWVSFAAVLNYTLWQMNKAG